MTCEPNQLNWDSSDHNGQMLKDCDHEAWLDSGMCLICTAPDSWMYSAACRDANPDTCFPPDEEPHLYDIAKRLCEICPVVGFCLEIGLDEKWGLWGGLDPIEREKLRKSGKVPKDRLEKRSYLRVFAYLNQNKCSTGALSNCYQNTCGNGVQTGLNLIRYTHKRTARFQDKGNKANGNNLHKRNRHRKASTRRT